MVVRVLLVLAVFAFLYDCGQASSPVERQEKKAGVEEAKPKEPTEQAGARAFTGTYKCEDFHSREAAQEYLDTTRLTDAERKVIDPDDNGRACDEGAYLFTPSYASASAVPSSEEQAERAEARCRVMTYVSEEYMSQQESTALRERVANRMIRMLKEMQEDTTLTVIHARSMALDDLGVPRYPECKTGGE
jgi:hypothetical protein